jgi:MATE family, multidrug efflux pump
VIAAHGRTFSVTDARVFAIAVPAMLANLTTPLLGVVSTAIIGRLGEAHLIGAAGMSALIFDLTFWLFGFLRMGTVALTAQAMGAGDAVEQQAVLLRALLIAAMIGLALIILQVPLAAVIYDLMGGSAAMREAAEVYFRARIWSAPFALANYAILGWLVGIARARTALALQILINLLNMGAAAVLVLGLGLGIAGAGIACVAAEVVGLLAGLGVARALIGGMPRLARTVVLRRDRLVRMLAVNRDIMIRTAALIAAFGFFAAQGARAGDVTLAANAVLHNVTLVGSFFLDGLATAAEQLCGRAVGARDATAFRQAVRRVVLWGYVFGAAASVVFIAGGDLFIAAMTTSAEVRAAASAFMLYAALAPLIGVLAYGFDGIYVGATWTRDMRNLMVLSLVIYLAAWWITTPLGNAGLWCAFLVFLAARGLLQALRYPALVRTSFAGTQT